MGKKKCEWCEERAAVKHILVHHSESNRQGTWFLHVCRDCMNPYTYAAERVPRVETVSETEFHAQYIIYQIMGS